MIWSNDNESAYSTTYKGKATTSHGGRLLGAGLLERERERESLRKQQK